jgi:integrase
LAQTIRNAAAIRHRRGKPPEQFSDNFALDRKIKEAVEGLAPSRQWKLMEFSDEDKELLADYILDYSNHGTGRSMRPNTKKGYIDALTYLSRYVKNNRNEGKYKPLKDITRDDFFAQQEPKGYLRSLKRNFEKDPRENWINTHNTRAAAYLGFWGWLTQKDLPREQRQTPPQLKGYRPTKHSPVNKKRRTRKQLWAPQEHVVFLKYCEDLRIACAHAMAHEIGCRPGELLDLKLGDIKIETVPSTGKKVCEFRIGGGVGGKMKKDRPASISDAIPFFNVWAHVHPARDWKNSKDAYLFPSRENKAKYRNVPLNTDSFRLCYYRVIEKDFPKLLDRPEIPLEDKAALGTLIYDKPHFPYIFRHEFSTYWAPRLPRMIFNQLLGHSPNSRMQDFYIHEMGDEGVRELEIAKGVRTREDTISPVEIELQPKYCPICKEANKQNAKFCFKCNFTISTEGALENREKEAEATKEAEKSKKKMRELEAKQEILQANSASFFKALMAAELGLKPKVEIITWNAKEGSEGLFAAAEIARGENQKREKEHIRKTND